MRFCTYLFVMALLLLAQLAPAWGAGGATQAVLELKNRMDRGDFSDLNEDEMRQALKGLSAQDILAVASLALADKTEYSMVLSKQERLRGELTPEPDIIDVRYRKSPLSTYLRYIGGASEGREVLLNEALRPGEITVAEAGLLGLISFHLDANSALVKRSSNHSIYDLGLEFPISLMQKELALLAQEGRSIDLTEGKLIVDGGKRYWELVIQMDGPPAYYAHWARLRFDIETALIKELEVRDETGTLREKFTYQYIEFESHPEGTFDEKNPGYRF